MTNPPDYSTMDHRALRAYVHQARPDLPYRGGILKMSRDELIEAVEQAQSKTIANQAASITFESAPECLTPGQVQELLQVSRATFFRLVERGELPGAVKIGGSWRVWRDKLRAYMKGE